MKWLLFFNFSLAFDFGSDLLLNLIIVIDNIVWNDLSFLWLCCFLTGLHKLLSMVRDRWVNAATGLWLGGWRLITFISNVFIEVYDMSLVPLTNYLLLIEIVLSWLNFNGIWIRLIHNALASIKGFLCSFRRPWAGGEPALLQLGLSGGGPKWLNIRIV